MTDIVPPAPDPGPGWQEAAAGRVADSTERLIAASGATAERLVLVQPPFASPDRPALGLEILAELARAAGWPTAVVYANLGFAETVGPNLYRLLCHTPTGDLVGERLFRLAHPRSARHGGGPVPESWAEIGPEEPPDFAAAQAVAAGWADTFGAALASLPAEVVGFSTVFEQTMPGMALAFRVRQAAPGKRLLLGGANADDVMGAALARHWPEIDHVFQGEAEAALIRFLAAIDRGETPPRLIPGAVNTTLDALPPPDYDGFFAQFAATVERAGITRKELRLPYESSRGCWWGAKHHCTFCGLNANGMTHRIKDPVKTLAEVTALSHRHGIDRILMVDNIMPHSYFSTLLPELARAERKLELFYEQKANLSRRRMALLAGARVKQIQPGIEALSTALLRRMDKGATLRVNLDCLRHARAAGVSCAWNLLVDFPGDAEADYEATLALIPALHHLEPPSGVGGLSIDRFSPYHTDPGAYGIAAIRPMDSYAEAFPGQDDPDLAYHFVGDYPAALRRRPDLRAALEAEVEAWRGLWFGETPQPLLFLFDLGTGRFLLTDTRPIARTEAIMVSEGTARMLLTAKGDPGDIAAALDVGLLLRAEGQVLPIATAPLTSQAWEPAEAPAMPEPVTAAR